MRRYPIVLDLLFFSLSVYLAVVEDGAGGKLCAACSVFAFSVLLYDIGRYLR
jgi:hypothetical protein